MNLLIPSAGMRYPHHQYFKNALGYGRIVTTEINNYATGILTADVCYKVPRIGDPGYLDVIERICDKEEIGGIIPIMDQDILVLSRNRQRFERKGIRLLMSPAETIEMGLDKLETYRFAERAGIPMPFTCSAVDWQHVADTPDLFPMLIKPRFPFKRSQKGYLNQRIDIRDELLAVMDRVKGLEDEHVLQQYIGGGVGLTIDFFCDGRGKLISVVAGERRCAMGPVFTSHGGIMTEGRTFHDPAIEKYIQRATEHASFFGPSNFQGYRNADGSVSFYELNVRLVGATVMSYGAGYDFFAWSVALLNGEDIQPPVEDYKDIYLSMFFHPVVMDRLPEMKDPPEA